MEPGAQLVLQTRHRRALVSVVAAAAVVTALAASVAEALSGFLANVIQAHLDARADAAVFAGALIACFVVLGFAVRILAGVSDAWYAMFAGAFVGGAVWGVLVMDRPASVATILLAPVMGGIGGAWAAGIFGNVGYAVGSVVAKRFIHQPRS